MRLFLTISIFLLSLQLHAGHLVGGEISYRQISGDTYEIQLRMYRDCYAGPFSVQRFDSVAYVSIYHGGTNALIRVMKLHQSDDSTRLPLIVDVPCLPDPPDLCILEMIYKDTLHLDVPPPGVTLVNQRCCRSPNSLNINNPGDYGSTYSCFIPGSNLTTFNSSPVFNQVPPIALCVGLDLELDYSATDPDGDSLFYKLCTPLHGAGSGGAGGMPFPDTPAAPPFDTVSWSTGYGPAYQIPSNPAFQIDSSTGLILGRPSQLGTYVFGVCVQEFRNGVLLGENRRDFQMTATQCDVEAAAAIDSAIEECIGLEIQFFNLSTLGQSFMWNFGDPTTTDDTSSKLNASYVYPDTGWYTIRLVAMGIAGCSDTSFMEYRVLPKIAPEYVAPEPDCHDVQSYDFRHEGYARPTTTVHWVIQGDTIEMLPDETGLFKQKFDSVGFHYVTLIYEDFGCVKEYVDTIEVFPNPTFELNEDYAESCPPFKMPYSLSEKHVYKPSYMWQINDTLVSDSARTLIVIEHAGYHDLEIVLLTDSHCIDTVTRTYPNHIRVLEPPVAKLDIDYFTTSMFDPRFNIVDSSLRSAKHWIYVDSNFVSSEPKVQVTMADTGDYVIKQNVVHKNGCTDSEEYQVRVLPQFLGYTPNTFTPNGDVLNETWFPSLYYWKTVDLHIFDRWGKRVFQSNDPANGWNGEFRNLGEKCPVGVYGYQLVVHDPHGRQWHFDGTVTLLR
jgi:gliding motility-associated-like protein